VDIFFTSKFKKYLRFFFEPIIFGSVRELTTICSGLGIFRACCKFWG